MVCPEKRFYIAIVKQAVVDYKKSFNTKDKELEKEREVVLQWVIKEEGTFPLCSLAWGSSYSLLKEKLLKTFEKIKNERKFSLYSYR